MNDALRAAVFARDKAICSFSGLSVWYLDHGTAPFSHPDWIDHVKPKSRGGKDTLDNLVCASHFYNRKKLNNGSDCQYLFSAGSPTQTFFLKHGEVSIQQAEMLKSHSTIEPSDWYFNRSIFNVMVAISNELAKANAVRTKAYWIKSARKRMETWKKMTNGVSSFKERGLVRFSDAADVILMLELCDASEKKWEVIYKKLLRFARVNENTICRFYRVTHKEDRKEIIRAAIAKNTATAPTIKVLQNNYHLLCE